MKKTSQEIVDKIKDMYIANGNKTKGIAEAVGVNKSTVIDVLKRECIKIDMRSLCNYPMLPSYGEVVNP